MAANIVGAAAGTGQASGGIISGTSVYLEEEGRHPTVEEQVRAMNSNDGVTKQTDTPMTTAAVEPVTAPQPNTTETDSASSGDFSIDTWRNGGGDGETANPYTFDQNGDTDDGSQASMSLTIPASSTNNPAVDIISAYTRFFLQGVTEAEQEKYQIVETFTGFYAFFYGKRPPIYRYTGLLISDQTYRWNNDFKFVYENYFRGSSATSFGAEVIMVYDGRQITGFPLSLAMQQDAVNDKGIPFSMDVLVVDHHTLKFSDDIAAFLQDQQSKLNKFRNNLQAYVAQLTGASGDSATTADNVLNGITPASSITTPGGLNAAQAISQVA